jgi:SpoU rRNA methylase family enzyme
MTVAEFRVVGDLGVRVLVTSRQSSSAGRAGVTWVAA